MADLKTFLLKLIEKYDLEAGKIIFSKVGFVWIATDHDKLIELQEKDSKILEKISKGTGTIIVYTSGDYFDIYTELSIEEIPLLIAARTGLMTYQEAMADIS